MDYLKPATFNDELVVMNEVAELKRASLIFHQSVVHPTQNHEIINTSVIKVPCLDVDSMKVKAIPQPMIEQLI